MKWKNTYSLVFLFFLLLVLDAKAFTQNALERKVTFDVKNADLKRVLKIIENQTKVKFAYSLENIGSSKLSITVQDEQLFEVLDRILSSGLAYEAVGDMVVLRKASEKFDPITVSGKVVDEKGSPLPGVTIKVKGNTIGTSTDANGNYSLRVPDDNATLVFSYLGFTNQETAINKRTSININLAPDATTLSEVVVIGYGTQKRENVIGSIATISGEKLQDRPVTQLQNALTGQLPGVTVTQRNGRPGFASGAISVRGVGSFGADPSALILVDGIPVGGFNNIDPNDVESISVLKDASSAAIYGSRAANGVILVTTKSGKEGKTKVNYSSYVGVQTPTALPEFVNSWEYAIGYNEAGGSFTAEDIEKFRNGSDPDRYPNTDFLNAAISKNGVQTSHNIGVNGGSKTTQYNLSLGYLFQDGVVVKNNYSRYNVRLNLNTEISPKLLLTTRIGAINSAINEPMAPVSQQLGLLSIIDQAARIPSTYPGQLSNGDYGLGINLNGTTISQLASESFSKSKDLNLNGNLRLDYKIIKPLKLSFISSYVQRYGTGRQFQATQRLNSSTVVGPSRLTDASNNGSYYTLQGLAEYTKQFGKHQFNLLGGYSFEANRDDNISAFRDNLPNDLTVINIGDPANQQSKGSASEWALESQFARANYSYAGKYLVEGVIRRDGSSRFPTSKKYAYFPSLAIGWRIGQESFIKDNYTWVSELKLKASSGVLGNQNIGNYPYQNLLDVIITPAGGTNYSFGGAIKTGASRITIVDNTLHWESTRTTDVGMEFGLFKSSLTGSVTYFNRNTYDILYKPNSSVSNVLGFKLSERNTGKLENNGWEFTLNYAKTVGKVGLNINTNFSIINNKVLDLGVGNINQPNGLVGNGSDLFIGYPLQLYYGFMADGLFVDQADINAWPNMLAINPGKPGSPGPSPGDIRYRDISGPNGVPDGKVDNTYDRTYLGSQVPKYNFGVNMGANYKGFDLNLLLQGVAGVKGYLNNVFGYAFFNNGNLQRWQYEGRWTADNPDRNAVYPRLEQITNSGTPNTVNSSFWTLDGSYLRIKNVQLGYAIPKSFLDRVKISNVRLYLSGENLHTFSKYRKGWDPEVNTFGSFYPILSNYTFGVNATF